MIDLKLFGVIQQWFLCGNDRAVVAQRRFRVVARLLPATGLPVGSCPHLDFTRPNQAIDVVWPSWRLSRGTTSTSSIDDK